MALMRWDPWEDLARLREEVTRLFERPFFGPPFRLREREEMFEPLVDVYEADKEVVVKAELPGIDPKDVEVRVFDEAVLIRGETKEEREEERPGYYRRERRQGKFYRQVRLPALVKPDEARATFRHGLLEVRAPKAEPVDGRGRRVEIKTED